MPRPAAPRPTRSCHAAPALPCRAEPGQAAPRPAAPGHAPPRLPSAPHGRRAKAPRPCLHDASMEWRSRTSRIARIASDLSTAPGRGPSPAPPFPFFAPRRYECGHIDERPRQTLRLTAFGRLSRPAHHRQSSFPIGAVPASDTVVRRSNSQCYRASAFHASPRSAARSPQRARRRSSRPSWCSRGGRLGAPFTTASAPAASGHLRQARRRSGSDAGFELLR
jgi:hypothetical protein